MRESWRGRERQESRIKRKWQKGDSKESGDLLKASRAFSHSHGKLIKLLFSDRQKAGRLF